MQLCLSLFYCRCTGSLPYAIKLYILEKILWSQFGLDYKIVKERLVEWMVGMYSLTLAVAGMWSETVVLDQCVTSCCGFLPDNKTLLASVNTCLNDWLWQWSNTYIHTCGYFTLWKTGFSVAASSTSLCLSHPAWAVVRTGIS